MHIDTRSTRTCRYMHSRACAIKWATEAENGSCDYGNLSSIEGLFCGTSWTLVLTLTGAWFWERYLANQKKNETPQNQYSAPIGKSRWGNTATSDCIMTLIKEGQWSRPIARGVMAQNGVVSCPLPRYTHGTWLHYRLGTAFLWSSVQLWCNKSNDEAIIGFLQCSRKLFVGQNVRRW